MATERFWDFSVRTYRTAGVPRACLSLQNDDGLDVNIVLFCCWTGGRIGQLSQDLYAKARELSRVWANQVVKPLRHARTWMKAPNDKQIDITADGYSSLREEIKQVELLSEKLQQEFLESLVGGVGTEPEPEERLPGNIAANLVLYSNDAGVDMSDDVRKKLATIILAAYPNLSDIAIAHALSN